MTQIFSQNSSPSEQTSGPDESLGRAANRYVSFQIGSAIVGGIIFLIVLFAVILPAMNHVNQGFSQNQSFSQPGGTTYTMNGHPATPAEQRSIDAAISQGHASGQASK